MEKDFDSWTEYKKDLENRNPTILYKEGEIWWTSIGINIGNETCGKGEQYRRPVLVIKKLSRECCIVVPLSSKQKLGTWFSSYTLHGETFTALLYQIKMVNTKRFTKREAQLDSNDFDAIKKRLKLLLNL